MNTFDQGKIVEESGVELAHEVAKTFEKTNAMEGPQDEAKPPDDKQEVKKPVSKVSEETEMPVQEIPEEQIDEMEVIQGDKNVKKKEQN